MTFYEFLLIFTGQTFYKEFISMGTINFQNIPFMICIRSEVVYTTFRFMCSQPYIYSQQHFNSSYHYFHEYYYVVIETTHSGIVYGIQSSHKYFGHNWCRILQQLNAFIKQGRSKNRNSNCVTFSDDLCPSYLSQRVNKKARYGL